MIRRRWSPMDSSRPQNPSMRIKQLIPDDEVRSKVLALAGARGVSAIEDGICVYFDLPGGAKGFSAVSAVLKAATRSVLILDPLPAGKKHRPTHPAPKPASRPRLQPKPLFHQAFPNLPGHQGVDEAKDPGIHAN
jgi:hypothetical protein